MPCLLNRPVYVSESLFNCFVDLASKIQYVYFHKENKGRIMGMINDFKEFALKGNLIDMAVGIVMGGAVAAIVKSFLDNIITPLISMAFKVPDLSSLKYNVGEATPKLDEAGEQIMNKAGEVVTEQAAINYGTFIQNTMDFLILAFVIFIALKIAAGMMKSAEEDAPIPPDIELLTEIRDALKK